MGYIRRFISRGLLLVFVGGGLSPIAMAQEMGPPRLTADGLRRADLIEVKFREPLMVRVRDGDLSDLGTGSADGLRLLLRAYADAGFIWQRHTPDIEESKLEHLRQVASARLGKAVPDQNLVFHLRVPGTHDVFDVVRELRGRGEVEWAEAVAMPPPPPLPPDYTASQGYAQSASAGVGATLVRGMPGGDGAGVRIVDIEYSWNASHQDLAPVQLVGPDPVDPFNDMQHGTAVLGVLAGLNNGFGITGLAYNSEMYFVAANTSSGYNVAAAINRAMTVLEPGDVMLIEQQAIGPLYTGVPGGTQFGLVPVEWNLPVYMAIVTAVGNGITVIEAAGNGSQNLDDPVYSTGNSGHWPFLEANDSGAIMIGAGSWAGAAVPRTRLSFSNYGSTLDLQGWGERVFSTGYGNLYNADGPNFNYTGGFSGTSSASAIAAGAAALVQAMVRAETGSWLSPLQLRDLLRYSGTPQGGSSNIGPLPDVAGAIDSLTIEPIPLPGSFQLLMPQDQSVDAARPTTFTWSTSAEAASYSFRVDDDPDFSSPIFEQNGLLANQYVVSSEDLAPDQTYYWSVDATNVSGSTIANPSIATFRTAAVSPLAFSLLSPADGASISTLTPTLMWSMSEYATMYDIALDDSFELVDPLFEVTGLTELSVELPQGLLVNSQSYFWRVIARNEAGNITGSPAVALFTPELPFCPGDANNDRDVDFEDITAVLLQWGGKGPLGDANGDDHVNLIDITTILGQWNAQCP